MSSIQLELEGSKIKLPTSDRDAFFKREFSKLRLKVALNWVEITTLCLVTFLGTLKFCFILGIGYIAISMVISIIFAALIVLLFSYFREYQLKITRFDKEYIYQQISADLIEQSKQ